MKTINITLNNTFEVVNVENPYINQYSSDTTVYLYSPVYLKSVNITFSTVPQKQFMMYDHFDGKYYVYKYDTDEYATAVPMVDKEKVISMSFRGMTDHIFTTPSINITMRRTNTDKEYDYSYNGKDVEHLWEEIGLLKLEIEKLRNGR